MGVSKVSFDGNDLINLENDTVTANTLARGVTAHDANGDAIEGAMITTDISVVAPAYSTSATYNTGDVVSHENGVYIALTDGITGAWVASKWQETNMASVVATKQEKIADLTAIRAGAALGATAVQPEAGKGLFSGSYNDLTNKPTIPSALSDLTADSTHRTVTDIEKASWNAKYSKHSTGIPKTDLASAVQGSLDKAESALQQETDPTVPSWAKQTNKPSYTAAEISDNGTTVAAEISAINGKISSQASSTNKLVSASEMGDAIAAVEAKQLYANATQGQFATKAALTGATKYYNADGTEATPTKNDVAYVLADESHDGKSAKYVVASVSGSTITWGFVITFSTSTFSQAQMDAINSGVTSTKREGYDTHVGNGDIHVTASQKNAWSGKQDAISDLATIRSGAALGATAVQPETGKGLFSGSYNDLTNKPDIPDALADLTDDSTHRLVTDAEKTAWNGKQAAISDLATIRSGAALGATALQSVPNTYRTSAAQDTIDNGKEDKGKVTLSGTQHTITGHVLSWTEGGTTHSYNILTY